MVDKRIKVLLIEDNADYADLMRLALADAGSGQFELLWVDRLRTGLARLRCTGIDVVLLDLSLPDGKGIETLTQVCDKAPATPVVVLAAHDHDELTTQALRAGAQDYLVTGRVDRDQLVRAIRYAIECKRAETAERKCSSLQGAVRAMEQVLGVVGHELRTPLAALRATSEFLLTEDAHRIQEWELFLKSINDETIRMTNTVNDLLEATRLNCGIVRWNWGTVRLQDVCHTAMDEIRPLLDHRNVRLECSVEPSDLTMNGDSDAIRRLVLNLVNNAHKHTKEGSIRVLVARPIGQLAGPSVEIEVQDTGEGIRPEVAGRLGIPFALNSGVAGSRYAAGTGLGMAICKVIVAAHGGTMAVRSACGNGTTVTVRLRADLSEPAPVTDHLTIQQEIAA